MAGDGGSPVPKFSSFKPKKSATASRSTSARSTSTNNSNVRSGEVKLGRHRVEKSSSHHSNNLPLRQHNRHRSAALEEEFRYSRSDRRRGYSLDTDNRSRYGAHLGHARSDRSVDTYTIDLRGDAANLQYRRPNKWTVPLYRLHGSGSILGLDPDIKIDRKLSDEYGFALQYPTMKRAARLIDAVELDEVLDPAPDDTLEGKSDSEGADDSEVQDIDEEALQATEADFVALPGQEQHEAPRLPIITPKA